MREALIILVVGLVIALPGCVTILKGRWDIFLVGIVLAGLVWVVGAFGRPRADSFWAQRRDGSASSGPARRQLHAAGLLLAVPFLAAVLVGARSS